METFSALLAICAGNSPVSGEFPAQRPVTRSFDVFFDVRLIKRLSKHSRGWWFETLSHPLWRHRNDIRTPITETATTTPAVSPPSALKLVIMTAPCGQWRQCSQCGNSRSSVYGPIRKKKNNNNNMNAQYTKAKRAKGGKKPRKVYGSHGCRSRIFLVRNNQCRKCRCSRNKVHKCTEIISLNWIIMIIVITTVK